MRRRNSNVSDKSNEDWKPTYLVVIAVGTIQFLLSLLIFSYSVFLMKLVLEDFSNLKNILWTPVAFVASSKITNPWVQSYCKHLDNIRHKVHKRNIILTVILLFVNLVIASFFNVFQAQILFYGIAGGILSSIINIHLKFVSVEVLKHQNEFFHVLDQITKPFVLIFMPHLVLALSNLYGVAQTQLILSAIILNIIPACLLIKKKIYKRIKLCKFQTIDRLSIEMTDLNPKLPVIDESSTSSSDDDNEYIEEEIEKIESDKSEPSSPEPTTNNVQKYFENFGVNILPNIPEEDETDDDDDINEISRKRLSRISAILQELNENTPKNINLSITNLFQPDENVEIIEPEYDQSKFIDKTNERKPRCFSFSSDAIYDWKVKKRKVRSFFYKNFVKSIPRTLSNIHFYPSLISSCITTLASTIIFATAPYLVFIGNEYTASLNYPSNPEEATFLLTIIGFTWLFFLAGYPIFSTLSQSKTKILFLLGLSISGSSLFIAHKFSYDNFTLFALTFGLGHGIITYAENTVYENFFGEEKWKITQGALEISTGFIVILIYLIIYYCFLEMYVLLTYAYWFYVFDVAFWIVVYVVKFLIVRVKNVRRYNVQRYANYDF